MGFTVLAMSALVGAFTYNYLFVTATEVYISTVIPRVNRTSKELHEGSLNFIHQQYPEQRTTVQMSNSDDYNAHSSSISDIIVGTSSPLTRNNKAYPLLTTRSPNFVTRSRFISNPFFASKEDHEMEFEDDPYAESTFNGGFPKWNRFNNNHRQLNKYGPIPIDGDIQVDEDGSTGYGSSFDTGGAGGSNYESGNYRNPGNRWAGGNKMVGWFSEPLSQPPRSVPIIAEIRHPENQKMSVDLSKIGILALIKIALAKLKALGFIKAKLLILFKLKLLVLIMVVKFLMLVKFFKISLILPLLLSMYMIPLILLRLSRLNTLLQQPVLVPNNMGNSGGNGEDSNDDGLTRHKARFNPLDLLDTGMKEVMRSENCVERMSCRMAGADHPSLKLIGLNWAASPILKYIPNEKIRTFVSTFTEVINYRLDNLYSNVLPSNWTKWCNDRYGCKRKQNANLSR